MQSSVDKTEVARYYWRLACTVLQATPVWGEFVLEVDAARDKIYPFLKPKTAVLVTLDRRGQFDIEYYADFHTAIFSLEYRRAPRKVH